MALACVPASQQRSRVTRAPFALHNSRVAGLILRSYYIFIILMPPADETLRHARMCMASPTAADGL